MKLPYVIAVVAAVGIAVAVMKIQVQPDASDSVSGGDVALTEVSMQTPGTVKMAVPEMHCQYSCFPRVKEALEASSAIESVELAPQIDPTVLDDHSVIVHYNAGFKPADAIAELTREGFTDSSVVK